VPSDAAEEAPVDFNDPQTLWLNLTNIALGIVTIACVGMCGFAAWRDVVEAMVRARQRRPVHRQLTLVIPGLGVTMADGGEPVAPPDPDHKDA
jgi:hypothetical protein